ncbi:MAG: 50S ribosomal protein L6 [Candidatus Kerfeldbacteria bacterium]|nr:50S ribosomal protein L6 [Candidatus Kerfeldbacteria bacterium]
MSIRAGKRAIIIPESVTVTVDAGVVTVKGSKGTLQHAIHPVVSMNIGPDGVLVSVEKPEVKKQSAVWGTFVSLMKNMITGVSAGYEKKLEINGVGYGWNVAGKNLTIKCGYSHPVVVELPEGITASVEGNVLTLAGIDKQLVGELAANIRKIRLPEPYKGKGIKYADEQIRRKAGKQAAGDKG